jgi:hypothetical protein
MERSSLVAAPVASLEMHPVAAPTPRRAADQRRAADRRQAGLGNRIVQRTLGDDIHASAGRGQPLTPGVRAHLQGRLGCDLGAARIHHDEHAHRMTLGLGALAFTTGPDIFFRAGAYDPRSRGGMHLLTHELAHFKQSGGRTGAPRSELSLGRADDLAERRADAAADAVLAGRRAPDVGTCPEGQVRCYVDTNGGRWDTTQYAAFGPAFDEDTMSRVIGADIRLEFLPNSTMPRGDKIGIIQTVRTLTAGAPSFAGALNTAVALTAHDTATAGNVGLAIDRADDASPVYGSTGRPTRGKLKHSSNFTEGNQLGKRCYFGTNEKAKLYDTPRTDVAPNSSQRFEATAVVLEGSQKGKYLGSVSWGYTFAGGQGVQPVLLPLTLVSAGDPSAAFLEAANKWNTTAATTSKGEQLAHVLAPI